MPWEEKVAPDSSIPAAFVYGCLRAGLDFFLLKGYHYKVIAVTESPFHFQKGTEINNICQKRKQLIYIR